MSLFGAWALSLGAVSVSAAAPGRPDSTWVQLASLPEPLESPVFALAVSPADPGLLLVGTGSGSIYRSADGGATWTPAAKALGHGVLAIQFSPFKAGTVLAGTRGGLWKSTDAGVTWAKQASIPNTTVRSFGFARSLTLVGADGGLFSSRDGSTWSPYLSFAPLNLSAIAVAAVNDPPKLLAGADASRGDEALPLYVSQDGGTSWTNVKSLGSSTIVGAAAAGGVPPGGSNSRPLLVGTNAGAFISNDGGSTWGQISGLPTIDFNSAAFVANHADRFYVASDGGGTQAGGVWTTSDSGQTFRSLVAPIGSVTAMSLTAEETPTVYSATFRPIDHAVLLWSFHDTGGTPVPPIGGIPAAAALPATAGTVPAAVAPLSRLDLKGLLTAPEAPYLGLGLLSVLVLLAAVGLQFRRGREK